MRPSGLEMEWDKRLSIQGFLQQRPEENNNYYDNSLLWSVYWVQSAPLSASHLSSFSDHIPPGCRLYYQKWQWLSKVTDTHSYFQSPNSHPLSLLHGHRLLQNLWVLEPLTPSHERVGLGNQCLKMNSSLFPLDTPLAYSKGGWQPDRDT